LAFYEKVSPEIGGKKFQIPPPTFCPDCRRQRRLAFRNERKLYPRTCDLCKKSVISVVAPDAPHTVYCPLCWWGDGWNATDYGREIDFSRPFFDQFNEVWSRLPKIAAYRLGDEINSDYTHDGYKLKNCYLIFDGEQAQDAYYGECYVRIRDCSDFLYLHDCELCYECVHCQNCFNLRFSSFCQNCSESSFLLDCHSLKNCIACTNLHQKEYHIFNEPYSKEEFERIRESLHLDRASGLEAFRKKAEDFFLTKPRKAVRGFFNEQVSGDNLIECKDSYDSFDCVGLRDCRFCTNCMMGGTDMYDIDAWGDRLSLAYDSAYIGAGVQNVIGCFYTALSAADLCHSLFCMGCHHLFGCAGMRQASYCILNKQYDEQQYIGLVQRLIEHMQKTGEWGQFFPTRISAFAYNETVAQDYYPLTKEEVLARGWRWRDQHDEIPKVKKTIEAEMLPDTIIDTPDDILNWAIRCSVTGRPYRIQKSELKLYRTLNIPVPRKHFEVRHAARLSLRNPRKLWNRECAKCGNPVETSFGPDRPDIVYCEKCYLAEVY